MPVTLYFRSKENPDDLNAFVPPPQSVGHNMVRHILFWAIPGPPGEARIKSLSLILRRLDEIDDCIKEELRIIPTAIGYSVRRGNLPRKLDRMR